MSRTPPTHEPIISPLRAMIENVPGAPRRPARQEHQALSVLTDLDWQTQAENVLVAVGNPTMGFVERPVVLRGSGQPMALLPHRHDPVEILLPGPPSPSPLPRGPSRLSYRQVLVTPSQSPTTAQSRSSRLLFSSWEQLPQHVVGLHFWNTEECCIHHETLCDLQEPVALVTNHVIHVFEYAGLKQWLHLAPRCCDVRHQRLQNPYNREWVDLSSLRRVVLNKNEGAGNKP